MRNYLNSFLIVLVGLTHQGCLLKREKPATPETKVSLCLAEHTDGYTAKQVSKEGLEKPLLGGATVEFTVEAMEGQTFDVLGVRYIDNEPANYEVIQIKKGGVIVDRLSLAEIEKLPRNNLGCSQWSPN